MNRSKFNNRKTIVDGITFDSRLEADRYKDLVAMEEAGYIHNLELQPEYELIPKNKHNRKTIYKADFRYFDEKLGKVIVEDVKGFKTDVYKIKKKMLLHLYPEITFKEITK
jgi:hypothetical protein